MGHKRDKPDYYGYGIWEVGKQMINSDTIPALFTLSNRWRYVILDHEDVASIKMGNDSIIHYNFVLDSTKTSVTLYAKDSKIASENFKITILDSTRLLLDGVMASDSITVELKAVDLNSFTLLNRGFHWINETPYNK